MKDTQEERFMLKIENLTKVYGDKKTVDDLSLHIAPGEIYGFIGHNVPRYEQKTLSIT